MTLKFELFNVSLVQNAAFAAVLFSEYQIYISSFSNIAWDYRSVPTKNDILAPETVLKKRKSQEKERELRAADSKKKKEVRKLPFILSYLHW
jgi:hypothetical protein